VNTGPIRMFICLVLLWMSLGLHAQVDEIDSDVIRLSPEEETQHRLVLAEPVPINAGSDALVMHFRKNCKQLGNWVMKTQRRMS